MTTIIILGIIFIPVVMSGTYFMWHRLRLVYDVVALISAIVSFSASSTTIYSVIKNNTVFMTTLHALFIDPFFLIPSAYLGVYVIYMLCIAVFEQFKQ
ncbi:transposase [Alicyclobacillus dauci]|uniref:Transposase n=1 Tax=Alicyclobacillus dauci TaxID=1475485 RepID=A0ABY6Z0P7_9BACL|nr:transposase [Alicyclobacillus dauci]WAH36435.1 transposase [Alicyclobacillus dauci]